MSASINGDLSQRVVVRSHEMPWSPSPSGKVWRKRLHRVGPAESGQVTSVVRYEPGSTFPAHDHPGGEEILVLDGVFSDEHGDWPAGTYLLNPEGFRHAPFSQPGSMLFVKLRQFPGAGRQHIVLDTPRAAWRPSDEEGVDVKHLYQQPGFSDRVRLERWTPGSAHQRTYADGAELFVVEGELADELGVYPALSWLRFPVGSRHRAKTDGGCTLYVKEGGLAYLLGGV